MMRRLVSWCWAEESLRLRFAFHCAWMLAVGTFVGVVLSVETWPARVARGLVLVVSVWLADRRWREVLSK